MGLCPIVMIQGRMALFSGLLASWVMEETHLRGSLTVSLFYFIIIVHFIVLVSC